MRINISRSPYHISSGESKGTQDRVSIQVESDQDESPLKVAQAYKEVVYELNKKEETK